MATRYQSQSAIVQSEILAQEYYLVVYSRSLADKDMTIEGIENHAYSNIKLNSLWEMFWFSLPDSTAIRRGPFTKICDLCEDDELITDHSEA